MVPFIILWIQSPSLWIQSPSRLAHQPETRTLTQVSANPTLPTSALRTVTTGSAVGMAE